MKNFRLFATALFVAAAVTLASAQQNEDIAALRSKAEKGNGLAQYNLGLAYAEGHGVKMDRVEAFVWLSLARENGARGPALESLIAKLDSADLQLARQRLAEQKAAALGKMPVVVTRQAETENIAPVKAGTDAAASADTSGFSQQIMALMADKKQLSDELAKAWKEIDAANATLARKEKEAKNASSASASAADFENATKFNHELEASLSRTNEQKTALEQNLAGVQTELTRTKAELASQSEKSAKLAAAEAARVTPSAEMAALRNQLTAAQTQVSTLTSDLATVRASETQLHDNVAQLEQEKAQLSAKPAYPDLSGKVGELEAQLVRANHNAEVAAQSATAAGKQSATDLNASAAEVLRLQNALAARSAAPSYPDLSGKVRELEATVADSTQKLAVAESSQTELQRKLADATASAANAAKTAEEAAQLRREHEEISGRAIHLASENNELRAERERLQKQLADSGKQLRDSTVATTRVKELEAQTLGLQTSLGAANLQISSLQHSLAAKSDAPAYPDLSGKVRELEVRLKATNQQADGAVQTAANASKQSAADLNTAAAKIAQLQAELAAKSAPASTPDLSGRVRELETQLSEATSEMNRAKQEAIAANKARDEASKNRGPAYPNLAGRVVELQTALADTKHDLAEAQNSLRMAEQARAAAATPAPTPVAAVATAEPASPNESADLQKQLAELENKLTTALRGYALLQRDRDAQVENAAKSAEALTNERDTLASQVTALKSEVEQLKTGTSNQTAAAQAEATRASESLAALQRSTAQNSTDLAATRALLQQMQGANTVLANENYQLKTRLSPGTATTAAVRTGVTPVPVPVSASASTPASPSTTAAVTSGAARTHVVVAGDTLFRISQRYYGTANRWQEIYKANTAKLGTNGVLRLGTELTIP